MMETIFIWLFVVPMSVYLWAAVVAGILEMFNG